MPDREHVRKSDDYFGAAGRYAMPESSPVGVHCTDSRPGTVNWDWTASLLTAQTWVRDRLIGKR